MTLAPQLDAPARAGSDDGPSAARALRVCGWLTKEDERDPRLKIETLSRFHVVSRVTAPDGRMAIVKYPASGAASGERNLARELYVYRLARWKPAIATVLPRPILLDETRQILAVEYAGLAGGEWPLQFAPYPITIPAIAAKLGGAMARWHGDTAEIGLLPSLSAGVLHLDVDIDAATADRSAGAARFMRFIAGDSGFAKLLGEAKAVYRPQCLIHGDIRGDNWVFQDDEMKLIDWEMSGLGDPAWDVAGAFAEMALQAIRDGSGAESGASGWPLVIEALAPVLLSCYGAAKIRERLVPFTAARLLHVASEWVDAAGQFVADDGDFSETSVGPILAIVRSLIDRRDDAARLSASWT
jgi:hypothetical protein